MFQPNGTRRLSDEEAQSGVVSQVQALSGIKNYLARYTCDYLYALKNQIANAYAKGEVPPGGLSRLFYANFTPIKYGYYPVQLTYTLPGNDKPNSVKKHAIRFVE